MGLTPDGNKFDFSNPTTFDECWVDSSTSPQLAEFATDYPTYFDSYVISACAYVNKQCNRYFNQQQADQIYLNTSFQYSDYKTFVLRNRPLATVDNVWLQITDTFTEVSTNYIQIDTLAGVVKILPDVFTASSAIRFPLSTRNASNVWIRYTSGYEITKVDGAFTVNDVPEPIKLATAMYVSFLFEQGNMDSTAKSFKTLNYSQTNAGGMESGKLMTINNILAPYKISSFVARNE